MKIDNRKRHYYHITDQNWRKEKIIKPRNTGDNRAPNEPKTSRICVAPSIPHCLVSVYPEHNFNVYRTKYKVKAHYPVKVLDSKVTKEKWLIKPTRFIKVGKINSYEKLMNYLDEIFLKIYFGDGTKKSMNVQRKWLRYFQRHKDLLS